jgi:hypothetical protein
MFLLTKETSKIKPRTLLSSLLENLFTPRDELQHDYRCEGATKQVRICVMAMMGFGRTHYQYKSESCLSLLLPTQNNKKPVFEV